MRASKFRHVFGEAAKAEQQTSDLELSAVTGELPRSLPPRSAAPQRAGAARVRRSCGRQSAPRLS